MAAGRTFYEFFAGGGMARAGLGPSWTCLFANDMDQLKASTYKKNWPSRDFSKADIRDIAMADLGEGHASMAWASFPCQDLSLAGTGLGMGAQRRVSEQTRSGALWAMLRLIEKLRDAGRKPPILVLENVVGFLTLDEGAHFVKVCDTLTKLNYSYGAVLIDAKHFIPQSRPRVFVVAVDKDLEIPNDLISDELEESWHPPILANAYERLSKARKADWIWWKLGRSPAKRTKQLVDLIDPELPFSSKTETRRLLQLMTKEHRSQLNGLKKQPGKHIGNVYLRMRRENDTSVQRAEVAFTGNVGCLRTPKGGASRPRIVVVAEDCIATRLLSVSEAASLMGLPKSYVLPEIYHHAFRVIGDGVVVPVVRFLSQRLLIPLADSAAAKPTRSKKRNRVRP